MRLRLTLFLLFCGTGSLLAQSGANPPALNWRQVNTTHFKVIFPAGLEREGVRMANTLQTLHGPLSATLGVPPRKVPLVLQNQGVISNGFVTFSPFRSEFFVTAPQDYNLLGTNNWLNMLALHEFRHLVQYEKTYHSRTRLAYIPFGQNGLAALSHAAVPNWFWEGDAVAVETAFSPSGRGRIPDFDLLFRTTLLERGPYSYNKQHLGSFRDNVPNHYVTGYHMVTHVRRHHPADVWGRVMQEALDKFYVPFTFSRSMRHQTGRRVTTTYRGMVRELDSLWRRQADALPVTPATVINRRTRRVYTDYQFPQPLADGSVVALKSGLGDIPTLVRLSPDGQREEKLFTPGILNNSPMLSVAGGKIVWSEVESDLRWAPRNYGVIKTYDLATGTHQVLQRRTRLSSPALSPDAGRVAAVEVDTAANNYLVILETATGREVKRIAPPENNFIAMPRWSPDGRQVVVLRTRDNQRTISLVDVETGAFDDVLPYSDQNLGHPVMAGNYLYFNSPYNGVENIYAVDLTTRQQYQVVSRRYAGINPALNAAGDTIYFNDFSVKGFDIARMPNRPEAWVPLEQVRVQRVQYYEPLVKQENRPDILASVPESPLPVEKYRKGLHLFYPHSWMPTINPENNSVSLAVLSQDVLSTTTATAGYTRNLSENSGRVFAGASYAGWFPVLSVTGATGNRVVGTGDDAYHWDEKSLRLGATLPLNLTNSRYVEGLSLSANGQVTSVSDYSRRFRSISEQANGVLRHLNYAVNYRRSLLRSRRDLAGRFEQRGLLYLSHTPFGGDYRGYLFAANLRLAFPGLVRHHSLQVGGNFQDQGRFQEQRESNYMFSSPLRFPRGYSYPLNNRFYSFTANYAFPIWYPDVALGPFLYFQRLKANLFYDHGEIDYTTRQNQPLHQVYRSAGAELTTDFNFMRLSGVVLEAGVRVSYLFRDQKPKVELLLLDLGF